MSQSPPTEFPPPTVVSGSSTVDPRLMIRQVVMEVRVNGVPIPQTQWVRCRFSFAEPVATAQFMCPTRVGDFNDYVEIRAGTFPGSGRFLRFAGRLRNPSGEYWPRSVTHNVVGMLSRAAEFVNGQVTPADALADSELGLRMAVGGRLLPDILGRPMPWSVPAFWAQSRDIVIAVLRIAGVNINEDDIQGSGVLYGASVFPYLWSSGTPTSDNISSQLAVDNIFGARQAGESALAYIQRYDQIDAAWDGGDGGGFYRTSEGLGGRVYRWRIGGRPLEHHEFNFTENVNILDGQIERQYPLGNRVLVSGGDWGGGRQMFYGATADTAFMGGPVYAPNAPSSPMIEWSNLGMAWEFGNSMGAGAPLGMDCQTVAQATLLEVDKITPTGHVVTAEDYPYTQGISVLVQGDLSGGVGRLLSGEPFWVQGLTFDCGYGTEGEPTLTQTLELQGGGVDPDSSPPPDFTGGGEEGG